MTHDYSWSVRESSPVCRCCNKSRTQNEGEAKLEAAAVFLREKFIHRQELDGEEVFLCTICNGYGYSETHNEGCKLAAVMAGMPLPAPPGALDEVVGLLKQVQSMFIATNPDEDCGIVDMFDQGAGALIDEAAAALQRLKGE
jgi:hypothetical protein